MYQLPMPSSFIPSVAADGAARVQAAAAHVCGTSTVEPLSQTTRKVDVTREYPEVAPSLLYTKVPMVILNRRAFTGEAVSTSVRLPKDMVESLDKIASDRGYSRNEVVIAFLEWAIREDAEADPDRKKR